MNAKHLHLDKGSRLMYRDWIIERRADGMHVCYDCLGTDIQPVTPPTFKFTFEAIDWIDTRALNEKTTTQT